MASWKALLALVLSGCLARPQVLRREVDALQAEAPRCTGFAAFDRRLMATWAQVPEVGSTDELLATHARLSAARRACARQALAGLLATREKHGVQAAQEELDAMARAWDEAAFEALLREAFGAEVGDLRPLVAEARANAAAVARLGLERRDGRALAAWRPTDQASDGSAPLRDVDGKAAHARDAERARDARDDRALAAWRPTDQASDGSAPLRGVDGKAAHARDVERARDARDDRALEAWRPTDQASDGSAPLRDVDGKAAHARDAERARDARDDRALEAWRPTDQASDGSAPLRDVAGRCEPVLESARSVGRDGLHGATSGLPERSRGRVTHGVSTACEPVLDSARTDRDATPRSDQPSRTDRDADPCSDQPSRTDRDADPRSVQPCEAPRRPPPSPSTCRAQRPREGLACLVEAHTAAPGGELLPAIAAELAERGRHASPPPDARALAVLLDLARQLPAPAAQETLRAGLTDLLPLEWPRVEAAARSGHPDLAAVLARPFAALRDTSPRVDALFDAAVAHHLKLAVEAGPRAAAAALHRALATGLGGPPSVWPAPKGGWDTARWSCRQAVPALPPAPRDARLVLSARCRPVAAPAGRSGADEQRTFDLERELLRERIDGDVAISCGSAYQRVPFSVTTVSDGAGEGPLASEDASRRLMGPLVRELERAVAVAHKVCAAPTSDPCDDLDDARFLDVEERLAARALALGRWPACTAPWLERRYGLAPPALP